MTTQQDSVETPQSNDRLSNREQVRQIQARIQVYGNARLHKPTPQWIIDLAGPPVRWRRRWFTKLPEWDD